MTPASIVPELTRSQLAAKRSKSGVFALGVWANCASIVALDVFALSTVYWLVVLARYYLAPSYHLGFYLQLYPGIILFLVAFLVQGLYPGVLLHPVEEIRRVSYGVTTVFLLVGAATFVGRDANSYSRSVFLITWSIGVPAILLARGVGRRLLSTRDWWGIPAVILGSGPAARRLASRLATRESGLSVRGILIDEGSPVPESCPLPTVGMLADAPGIAASGLAVYAIIAAPEFSSRKAKSVIQEYCRGFRHILLIPDLPYGCSLGVSALDVGGELGIEVAQRLFHRGASIAKRALDLAGSLAGLLLLSPVFLMIAALVKTTSHGTVLYNHPRYGLNGAVFHALKFRTMVTNGNEVLDSYFHHYPEQREIWKREHKLKKDPRVTPIGRWLRRFSLDELPQLLNVLAGQMSLVGPRPIVLNEADQYGESFGFCTSVRPGITGMWQVSGRNDLAFEERIRFNEYYIRNWSVWLDLYLLFRTVEVVAGGKGAY